MDRTRVLILAACLLPAAAMAGCVDASPQADVKQMAFWIEAIDWELHPGVTTPVWAYCAEGDGIEPVWGEPCGVPGPTVRVQAGDIIELTFRNTHAIPHTIHFHGWHGFSADMNGNGLLGSEMVVGPGEELTIEWVAEPRGSFIYHCHFDTPMHMEMGMYGTFIVEDPADDEPDIEYVAVLDEWQVLNDEWIGNFPRYDFFTINGKSFPTTQPWLADVGDHVRIHMVNAGYEFHAMHMHGYTPWSWEGVAGKEGGRITDVREIAPGQTVVLDFVADREGVWLFHDHVVPRVTAASGDTDGFGVYPRGMLTVLAVGESAQAALPGVAGQLLGAAEGDVGSSNSDASPAPEDPAPEAGQEEPEQQASPEPPAPAPGEGGSITTSMQGFKFVEDPLVIQAGTTVTWENKDSAMHTVTFVDGPDSGDIAAGASWTHTFTEPGTYDFYCKPHAYFQDDEWKGMVATLIVE